MTCQCDLSRMTSAYTATQHINALSISLGYLPDNSIAHGIGDNHKRCAIKYFIKTAQALAKCPVYLATHTVNRHSLPSTPQEAIKRPLTPEHLLQVTEKIITLLTAHRKERKETNGWKITDLYEKLVHGRESIKDDLETPLAQLKTDLTTLKARIALANQETPQQLSARIGNSNPFQENKPSIAQHTSQGTIDNRLASLAASSTSEGGGAYAMTQKL